MADETRNPDRANTETYGATRDAFQPMRTHDFTGSSLCHIIYIYNVPILKRKIAYNN